MSSSPRDEAQTIISHLAEIGPRRAGSPQEATVAAFINARLRHAGMGVTTHPLLATPRRRRLYLAAATCGIFAALTAIILPLPAIALAITAIIVLLLDVRSGPLLRLGRPSTSQTIVGTQAIAGDGDVIRGPRAPIWRVVLLAPLDSPVVARGISMLAGPAPAAALARIIALALVALAALADQLAPHRGWVLLVAPASILLVLQVAAALRDPQPAPADGGIGALTAMLLAAQRLRDLEHVEVWAVAVGATSLDSGGVEDLLDTYPFERDHTLVIGLEQISNGQLRCQVGAGEARREVSELITAATDTLAPGPLDDGPGAARIVLAETLRRRGLRAVTLYSQGDPGAAQLPRRAEPQLSEAAARLTAAIVAQLEGAG